MDQPLRLASLITVHLPLLQALSEARASRKPAPEVWSAKELLGHLIDSAVNNHTRFVLTSGQSGLSLPGYSQNDWVRISVWQERPWSELLALWMAYQTHLAHLINHLPAQSLDHILCIDDGEPQTLRSLTQAYVQHQQHHLAQLWDRVEM